MRGFYYSDLGKLIDLGAQFGRLVAIEGAYHKVGPPSRRAGNGLQVPFGFFGAVAFGFGGGRHRKAQAVLVGCA